MKPDCKNYFCGRQFRSTGWRIAIALIIYLYTVFFSDDGMDHHPTLWLSFRRIVEAVVFFAIPLFLLPVMVWGKLWQKVVAWLLSSLSFGVMLVMLIAYFKLFFGTI
ncbi:MAG: hypothetical protein M2R45_01194 [Verrucomicrobia subdivision 3 bacterium]|nr:hypothetical protein [Limisphaerales bacterium]MCS1415254.1 hypothetical protein [Limisphaerales bacterium]